MSKVWKLPNRIRLSMENFRAMQ